MPVLGQPTGRTTTVAYAATVTPNAATTDVLVVGVLTGNLTLVNPTGSPFDGQSLRIRFQQDATGSRTVTFGAGYVFGTDVTTALVPTTPSLKWTMLFVWNATDSVWQTLALVRGFA